MKNENPGAGVRHICRSHEVTGQACPTGAPAAVLVEHVPKHLRARHEAARNRGTYPHNGARRVPCCEPCAIDLVDDDWSEWVFRYTVSIKEADGTRWLYDVPGATFESVAKLALNEARGHGYAIGRTLVRVWQPECQGSTINHEPVAEFDLPEGEL